MSVVDTTSLLRITGHSTFHVSSISWTINKSGTGVSMNSVSQQFSYSIFPNPAADQLNIFLNLPRRSKLAMKVYSTDGKLVHQTDEKIMEAGKQQSALTVSNFASGTYLLVLQLNGQSFTEHWVKE